MGDARRAALRRAAGPLVACGLLLAVLGVGWSGLWTEPPGGALAVAILAGAAPALVRALPLRRSVAAAAIAAVVAAAVALAVAVESDPFSLVRADGAVWERIGAILPDGLGRAAEIPLPLRPDRSPPLSALLILVAAVTAAVAAWQLLVARRPLGGVITVAAVLGYRWTLVPPERPVTAGLVVLAAALVALALCSPARIPMRFSVPGRAVAAGAVVVALALAVSAGTDRTPTAWWNWEDWTFGAGEGTSTLDVRQRYGPLVYPETPVVIARVAAEEPVPLRAVSLEVFDGSSFVESPSPPAARVDVDGELAATADRAGSVRSLRHTVTLERTRTEWLLAGGRPKSVSGMGRRVARVFDDGSVRVDPALGPDVTYEVDAVVPDPGPGALLEADAYAFRYGDPQLLVVDPGFGPPVPVPVWGDRGAERPAAEDFGPYADVYRLSRRVVGDARTPYEAVNRVESYVRGEHSYDEAVPLAVGTPELSAFLFDTRRGYCQHFAGAMALMLRMNGIPARVAVGFTSDPGRFDPDKATYEIIDRDAHSWVEVLFPGFGWLPFDPTPGRSVPNSASVSSPSYSIDDIDVVATPGLSSEPVLPAESPASQAREREVAASEGGDGGPGGLWLLVIPALLLALAASVPAAKALRRVRRRRGDERARVLGAARELESFALDAGVEIDPALGPSQRAGTLWRELGIDADRIYGLASAARFAPAAPPEGAGAEAWRELRRARRGLGWARRARAGLRLRSLRARGRASSLP